VIDRTRTATEQHAGEIAKLNELLQAGAIDQATLRNGPFGVRCNSKKWALPRGRLHAMGLDVPVDVSRGPASPSLRSTCPSISQLRTGRMLPQLPRHHKVREQHPAG
jgi:hypothetical protein